MWKTKISRNLIQLRKPTAFSSPELWEILAKYFSIYKRTLPFVISLDERKVYLGNCPGRKRFLLKVSCILLMAYSVTTFVLLSVKLKRAVYPKTGLDDMSDLFRTIAMFYIVCLLPIFISPSGLVAFRADSICRVINPIIDFRARISGNA